MRAFPSPFAAGLAVLLLASAALAEVRKVSSEAYPTIQSAVDAAGDGDTVLVARSAGAYRENVLIEGKTNLTLRGSGKFSGIAGLLVSGDPTIRISGGANITLRGLGISTNSIAAVSCEAVGVAGLQIVDVIFNGTGETGLSTSGCTAVLVSRCGFAGLDGSMIVDDGSTGYVVERCTFTRPRGSAFAVNLSAGAAPGEGTDDAVLQKNVVKGSGAADPGAGFQVTGDGAVVDRNVLSALQGDGIAVSGSGSVVGRNRVDSGADAITVSGGSAVVDRNVVLRAGGHGILVDAAPATVTGNRVGNAGQMGIYVLHAGASVSKNRVSGSGDFDLGDAQAEGVNTYEKNRFGTIQFEVIP